MYWKWSIYLDYSCSLKGCSSGHLFITKNALYFYAKKRKEEFKEYIPVIEIQEFVKQNTAIVVANAIEVTTTGNKVPKHTILLNC